MSPSKTFWLVGLMCKGRWIVERVFILYTNGLQWDYDLIGKALPLNCGGRRSEWDVRTHIIFVIPSSG